jgi:flagellar basal body rod protein FlgC
MVSAIKSALSGMAKAVEKLGKAADNISKVGTTKDDTNLPQDIVDIKTAKHEYKANIAVLKAQKEVDESTLDIMA